MRATYILYIINLRRVLFVMKEQINSFSLSLVVAKISTTLS